MLCAPVSGDAVLPVCLLHEYTPNSGANANLFAKILTSLPASDRSP
jgi:hypothetical protein